MDLSGGNFEALCDDLDRALAALGALVERDAGAWTRGAPGRWTAGGHVEHVALSMEHPLAALDAARHRLAAGTLPPPPRRGMLQWLFVRLVVEGGRMPRGARTTAPFEPGPAPERAAVFARIARAAARHREIGAGLAPAERDRLWIANPFRPSWRYTLPELVRMHAVHARHHAAIVVEIARG